jgi:hypothetical protein
MRPKRRRRSPRSSFRDRIAYVLALAFTPAVADLNLIRLPAPLYPLYWLLRPVTILLLRIHRR